MAEKKHYTEEEMQLGATWDSIGSPLAWVKSMLDKIDELQYNHSPDAVYREVLELTEYVAVHAAIARDYARAYARLMGDEVEQILGARRGESYAEKLGRLIPEAMAEHNADMVSHGLDPLT